MKLLQELNPLWTGLLRPDSGEGLTFDCPNCGAHHRLCAYFSNPLDGKEAAPWQKPTWERIGDDFDVLTVKPSIEYPCFHGWIENGRVVDVREAPLSGFDPAGRQVALSPLQSIEIIAGMIGLEQWGADTQETRR
jgi:hypothetical protein